MTLIRGKICESLEKSFLDIFVNFDEKNMSLTKIVLVSDSKATYLNLRCAEFLAPYAPLINPATFTWRGGGREKDYFSKLNLYEWKTYEFAENGKFK